MFKILLSLLILTPFFSNGQLAKATYTMKVSMNMDFANNPNIPKNVAERIKKRMSELQSFNLFLTKHNPYTKKRKS